MKSFTDFAVLIAGVAILGIVMLVACNIDDVTIRDNDVATIHCDAHQCEIVKLSHDSQAIIVKAKYGVTWTP